MLYYSHGLEESFSGYEDYYNDRQDLDAVCYLTLANKLIHEVNPKAITIAEEVSGMPGLAVEPDKGGYGFDYRMAMNIPDFWIKTIKELKYEDWDPSAIFWQVTNRRDDEKTISYVESHDQALVGDKTIIFRLIDEQMYWYMSKLSPSFVVDTGIALHKMIRLVTATTINGGYLTFMGNEFGHPEWIDFPREGNNWSHKYARRQWSLNEDPNLKYHYLSDFDKEMISLIKSVEDFPDIPITKIWEKREDNVLAYMRGNLLFVYNFNPTNSYTNYGVLVPEGEYKVILNTDEKRFGGFGLTDDNLHHFSHYDGLYKKDHKGWLRLYIPAHTAVVLNKISK
jgi:1,4-alpha-glucan branching enzyme